MSDESAGRIVSDSGARSGATNYWLYAAATLWEKFVRGDITEAEMRRRWRAAREGFRG